MVHSSSLRSGLNHYVMVKQSVKQALREHNVHWLSSTERLRHEREDGENIRNLEEKSNLSTKHRAGRVVRTKFGLTTLVCCKKPDRHSSSRSARAPASFRNHQRYALKWRSDQPAPNLQSFLVVHQSVCCILRTANGRAHSPPISPTLLSLSSL